MKILHVIPDLAQDRGGTLTAVLGMAQAQSVQGHQVEIAATDIGLDRSPDSENVRFFIYRSTVKTWRWSPDLRQALLARVREADIVHLHTVWEYPVLAGAAAAWKAGKPYILRTCGMLSQWSLRQKPLKKKAYLKLLLHRTFREASAFHFTSPMERKEALSLGIGDRGFVVPLGIPALSHGNFPSPGAFYRRFPGLKGRRILLFLGRLDPKKRPEVAVEAFRKICSEQKDIALVLAGTGDSEYIESLRMLAVRTGIGDRIFFTGFLKRDAVREAYHAAELFLLPSLHENFGLSVAEAMAAGCPVIVSDHVDLATEVQASGAGLVGPPDVESFSVMIGELLKDEVLRRDMGKRGMDLVKRRFTWEVVTAELERVYGDVISGCRESQAWKCTG